MSRRLSLLTLAAVLSCVSLASPEVANAQGGDDPIVEPLTHSGDGETSTYLDQAGIEVFAVDDGHDLDHYLFRSSSPLNFAIDLDRDYGPVNADGSPAAGNALFGHTARLTLRAWDVDESYAGTDVEPEVDLIRVNGVEIDGQLTGADDQWSITTFRVDASDLRLPTLANPTGRNEFEVLIDTANGGADVWAVEVDWTELRPIVDGGPRPVALIHGAESARVEGDPTTNDMTPFRAFLETAYPELAGRVVNPFLDAEGSIEGRSSLLEAPLQELLVSTGAAGVNIAAHSYGGLVARRYAWDHRGEINSVVMIATPNGGVGGADAFCFAFGEPLCH